jgi:hypothetical protein
MGLYRKSDESILVTKNPYVVIITESDSAKVDSIWYTADTLFSKVVYTRDVKPYKKDELKADTDLSAPDPVAAAKPPASLNTSKDSTAASNAAVRDTSKRSDAVPADKLGIPAPGVKPTDAALTVKANAAKATSGTPVKAVGEAGKIVKLPAADSVRLDTARNRIVIAYHNAKIFKSDLQARADSMFFSYSDSTVRCYFNPILWAQGSQLTGDTIYLQLKNKKLNNMLLQNNSFIVNSEDADSTNFNQVKGKVITGFFRDNKLNQMFVDGNAETVYYLKDDTTYSGLNHSISSRIKITFNNGKVKNINLIRRIDGKTTPMDELTDEDRILKGFIWKPKDRPKSKEEIIPQLATKIAAKSPVKTPPAKPSTPKAAPAKTPPVKKPIAKNNK